MVQFALDYPAHGQVWIYQQTFIDIYSKGAAAELYISKTPITAADLLNNRVLPMFEEHGLDLLRILTDRGAEFSSRGVFQRPVNIYSEICKF